MKKSKLSEAKIIAMLNEGKSGVPVTDICRKYKVANSTYYKFKNKYENMTSSELQRLKALEAENIRLKQMYADISLDHKILKEVMEKKYQGLIDEN
tara:strand:- start:844 stop:1131 length:288 start_codon:yes stop_codon:yes gene_type:complete